MKLLDRISKINSKIALSTTPALSTMACVYLFLIWSLLPLIYPQSQSIVFYVSGGILQLVLLPLIMVGQKLASDSARDNHAKISSKHDDLQLAVDDIKTILQESDEEIALLKTIVGSQQAILENQQLLLSRLENIPKPSV